MSFTLLLVALAGIFIEECSGHGMMLDPPGRSSLWRFDKSVPANYGDNQLFCGGYATQWQKFSGKCGVCGDIYSDPHPQANENTGKYGTGKVVATYKSGSVITTNIRLTVNHLGYFQYSLCVLKDPSTYEPAECFENLKFEDGSSKYEIVKGVSGDVYNKVKLPNGVKCSRCVLRWIYTAGNNWGVCEDGTQAKGCGSQETFRACSDISIV